MTASGAGRGLTRVQACARMMTSPAPPSYTAPFRPAMPRYAAPVRPLESVAAQAITGKR